MKDPNTSKPDGLLSRWHAWIYDPVVAAFEERVLLSRRQRLLKEVKGKVLEVGFGTGINFPVYNKEASVLAIEPSAAMLEQAKKNSKNWQIQADIQLLQAGIGDEVVETSIAGNSLDAVVCTLVLCTIPDPGLAVDQFKRWLKPDGRLYVLEHIHARHQPARLCQRMLNPVWKILAEGCHLTRDTDELLMEKGFEPVLEEYFSAGMLFYMSILAIRKQ